jgi:hypothetical protein
VIAGWIASGHLIGLRRAGRTQLGLRQVLPNVLAGDFLLLAWLSNMRGAVWGVTAACLLGALVSHVTDMALRWGTD